MAKEKSWWEKDLEHIKSIQDRFKDATYSEMLSTVKVRNDKYDENDGMMSEDIMNHFGLYPTYDTHWCVPFLHEYPSELVWICTDTLVGLFFIFYVNEDGTKYPIGVREKIARKDYNSYSFFSDEYFKMVGEKLLEMMKPKIESRPSTISLSDKVFK